MLDSVIYYPLKSTDFALVGSQVSGGSIVDVTFGPLFSYLESHKVGVKENLATGYHESSLP